MAAAASQTGDADSSWSPDLTSVLQGSVSVHRGALLLVPKWQWHSHSTENWIFLKLHVADTTAQYWEKRDINPNVFILKFGCDTLIR